MDETIDLRPYVEALLRRWWVILGAVIAGVLIAVFLHFSQSNYRATALVVITDPAQQLQFDPRIVNTINLDSLLQAYPELAMSDGVMTILLEEAKEITDNRLSTLPGLRGMLDVEAATNPRLMRLIAQSEDPILAADLANAWANVLVEAVENIYLNNPGGEVQFFTDQLAQTNTQLQTAEQALVEFQSGSRMGIVDNELLSLTNLQTTYLAEQNQLNLVLEDISALREQIESGAGDSITWADQLTALMLQMRIYETEVTLATPVAATSPIQLQLDSQSVLTTSQREEQLRLLDDLAQTAERSLEMIEVKLLELEPRMFQLQSEKQDLFHRFEELTRNRDVAKETYMALARKIDEARIQSEDGSSGLKVASLAAPPLKPSRSNLIIMAGVAGLLGLLLSTAIIIVVSWWKPMNGRTAA